MSEITALLGRLAGGDSGVAAAELLPLVYAELRKLAAAKMAREKPGHTLQATALVHEAWLQVAGADREQWQNRAHFFGAAAEAMRRILIANTRRKAAVRHGGGQQRVEFAEAEIAVETGDDQLLAVDAALDRLTALYPAHADVVKLRYFAGMTIEEAAQALDIAEPTAKRHWAFARAWLARYILENG